jgi:integrase
MVYKYHTSSFTFEGKRYFCRAKTKAEAIAKATLKRKDLEKGKVEISRSITVTQWAKQYLMLYRKPSSTLEYYKGLEGRMKNHILSIIGGLKISSVRPTHCQAVLSTLSGKSHSMVNKVSQLLKDLFKKAQANSLCYANPAEDIAFPKVFKGRRRAITAEERKVFLKVCETHRYSLWALTMLYCGLRPSETSLITGKDIDLKKCILHVRGTKSAAAVRNVPLPPPLTKKLTGLKLLPKEYLFRNSAGDRLTRTNRKRMWAALRKAMHIANGGATDFGSLNRIVLPLAIAKDFTPYCLRHTFCTDLQAAGVPITVAKDLMGHASIDMTANVYTHLTDDAFENAQRKIGKYQEDFS